MSYEALALVGIAAFIRLIYLISKSRQGFGKPFFKIPIFSDPYGLVPRKNTKRPQRALLASEIVIDAVIVLLIIYMIIE